MDVTEEIMVVKIKPSSYQYSPHRVNKTHEWDHKRVKLLSLGETFCTVQNFTAGKVGCYDEAEKAFIF